MPLKGRLQSGKAPPTPTPLRILGFWVTELVTKVRQTFFYIFLQKIHKPAHSRMLSPYKLVTIFVKLRQGSGKDRQGMAVKAKGLKA